MSTDMPPTADTSYLGSKGKQLFRRAVWIQVLLIVLIGILGAVQKRAFDTDPTSEVTFNSIETVFQVAAWLLILLPYGLNCRIKAFRIMFFVVAGAISVGNALNLFSTIYSAYDSLELLSPALQMIINVMGKIPLAAEIVFMVVVLCNPKTGRSLRKASVLMLICDSLLIAFSFLSNSLLQVLIAHGNAVLNVITVLAAIVAVGVSFASQIYFLWAMAVSEIKKDPVDNVAEQMI